MISLLKVLHYRRATIEMYQSFVCSDEGNDSGTITLGCKTAVSSDCGF